MDEGQRAGDNAPAPALRKLAVLGLIAGSIVVAGAVVGGRSFISQMPGAWFFGTPGGPLGSLAAHGKRPPLGALVAVYGGLIVLCRVWLQALRIVRAHRGTSTRSVITMIGAWSLPFVVAPPLFSRDVYSYAGQGELVSHHINPYVYGTGVLGTTPFSVLAGRLWGNTPSPYGPTFLSIDGWLTRLSGHVVLTDLVFLRLLAVIGVGLLIVGIIFLTRSTGHDPASAILLGAGSPLALSVLVGGAHNDALMAGLLACGLAVALRVGPIPGIALCALAAGVKAPAALGIVFIGWTWAGRDATVLTRLARSALAGVIGLATLGVISALTGIGWGWIHTATAADHVFTGVTPVDALARMLAGAAHLVSWHLARHSVRTVIAVTALVVAGSIGAFQLWRSPRTGPVRPLGISLLVLALLGPILWPWYLTWGISLLAVVAMGRLRWLLIALTVVETLIGATSVRTVLATLTHAGVLPALLVVLCLTALMIAPMSLQHQPHQPRHAGDAVLPDPAGPPSSVTVLA